MPTDAPPQLAFNEARRALACQHCPIEACSGQIDQVARALVAARDVRDQQIVNYLQRIADGYRLQRKHTIADAVIGIARKIHRGDDIERSCE